MASLVMLETVLSDLKMAHEQQKKSLEEEFEKLRLSLQVEKLLLLSKHIHLFFLMANVMVSLFLCVVYGDVFRIRWTH